MAKLEKAICDLCLEDSSCIFLSDSGFICQNCLENLLKNFPQAKPTNLWGIVDGVFLLILIWLILYVIMVL